MFSKDLFTCAFVQLEQEFNNALFVVGAALLGPVVTDWGCSNNELCEFLHTLQWQYQPNPYHNQLHAAMVGSTGQPTPGLEIFLCRTHAFAALTQCEH